MTGLGAGLVREVGDLDREGSLAWRKEEGGRQVQAKQRQVGQIVFCQ